MTDEPKPVADEQAASQTSSTIPASKKPAPSGKSGRFWEWMGKIGVVVAVTGGLFAIYNYIYPRGPSITAYCTSTSIGGYLTHGYDTAVKRFAEIEREKTKRAEGKSAKKKPVAQQEDSIMHDALQTGAILKWGKYEFNSILSFNEPTFALTCRVVNEGTEPANEVTLYLPSRPVRFLVNDKEEQLPKSEAVPLKNVPAGPSKNVEVWLRGFGQNLDLREDRLFIDYQGGRGKVLVGKTYFGLWNTIKENWPWIIFFLLLGSILVLVILEPLLRRSRWRQRQY